MGKGGLALGATGILMQEADMVGTTLVDAQNGFNEISHLVILWAVHTAV